MIATIVTGSPGCDMVCVSVDRVYALARCDRFLKSLWTSTAELHELVGSLLYRTVTTTTTAAVTSQLTFSYHQSAHTLQKLTLKAKDV